MHMLLIIMFVYFVKFANASQTINQLDTIIFPLMIKTKHLEDLEFSGAANQQRELPNHI